MKRLLSLVLLSAFVFLIGYSFGWQRGISREPEEAAFYKGCPVIRGAIESVKASPDSSLIAIRVTREEPRANYVAIFNPVCKRIVSRHNIDAQLMEWSPNSKWLAVSGEELVVLNANRIIQRFRYPDDSARYLIWDTSSEDRLIYSMFNSGTIRACVLPTGQSSVLAVLPEPPVGLFYMKEELCAGRVVGDGYDRNRHISVIEIPSDRELITVPLYGYRDGDFYEIDMSPDGKYFKFGWAASASGFSMVARTEDSKSALNEQFHSAVYTASAIEAIAEVSWIPTLATGKSSGERDMAIINPNGGPGYPSCVHLGSGTMDMFAHLWLADEKSISWYENGSKLLVVDDYGLRITPCQPGSSGEEMPLLRCRPDPPSQSSGDSMLDRIHLWFRDTDLYPVLRTV